MKFLHEAYKCDSINLDNEYAGTWSFVVWEHQTNILWV
jgi:hypothetical protein